MTMRSFRLSALIGTVLCCGAQSFAADLPARPPEPAVAVSTPAWSYVVTPYAWLPSINGSTTIRGRTADIDASFGDLLDRKIPEQLFGLMGAFEARNGRVSVMTDLVYMKLGADGGGARARSVHPAIGGALAASMSAQFEMFIAEAALGYELVRWQGAGVSETAIDVYGGGRFWWQDAETDLALTAGLNVGDLTMVRGRARASSGDVTWLDPVVGVRLRHQFTPQLDMVLRGDVGGFGAGSRFSWQAMGSVNWEFARTESTVWSGMAGYRALYVDYERGTGRSRYEYDMLTHGPILGVTARF
jgi:hypothetical protein